MSAQFQYLSIVQAHPTVINALQSLGVNETYSNNRVHFMFNGESKASFMLKSVTIKAIQSGKVMQASLDNVQSRAHAAVKACIDSFPQSLTAGIHIEPPNSTISSSQVAGSISGSQAPTNIANATAQTLPPIEKPKPPVNYQDALNHMLGLPETEGDENAYQSIVDAAAEVGDIFNFETDPLYALLGMNDEMALCVHADSEELSIYFVVAFSPDVDIDDFLNDNVIIYKYLNFKRWYSNTMTVKVTPANAESKLISFSAYAGTICQMANFGEPLPLLAHIEEAMTEALAEVD